MYIGNWSVKKKEFGFVNRVVTVFCLCVFFMDVVQLRIGWALIQLSLAGLNAWWGWSFVRIKEGK